MISYRILQDRELFDLMKSDDDAAFKEIYERYFDVLFVHAYKRIQEKEEAREKKISDLELKIAAFKTATGRLDDSEKKEIDKRLNHYIREIDRCIALLSE